MIRLEAVPLLVVARFRGVRIASRMLVAEPELRRRCRAGDAFAIGAERGADAPVNPAYIGGIGRHPLLSLEAGAWALSLTPPMRVELQHGGQHLALGADPAVVGGGAPLSLPVEATLRVSCGEMTFDITGAGAPMPLPRPYLAPGWRREARYLLAAALALGLLVLTLHAIPGDSKALSLDDIGRNIRLDRMWRIPPVTPPAPGGGAEMASGGARPTRGPEGAAGDRHAPPVARKMAIRRTAAVDPATAARVAAAQAAQAGVLGLLRAEKGSALAQVMDARPVLGDAAEDVLAHLEGTAIAAAYGLGGLGRAGTGAHGAGVGEGLEGSATLGTHGIYGDRIGGRGGPGTGPGYGDKVPGLGPRQRVAIQPHIEGSAHVRGALDKETVRRIVRLHLNEVRYCYEEELPRHPGLAGRLVVQFAIAGTGQVISSVLESTTIGEPRVGQCVLQAVKRWTFPHPEGGGMVLVSYPFQLQPAGS